MMKGIRSILTHDGVRILWVHYTADPTKDPDTPEGADWIKKELVGYPGGLNDPKWRKEMEIDFHAFAGQLLFPFLLQHEGAILVPPRENVPETWFYSAGFDYGARNPSAFIVTAWDEHWNPWTIWEFYEAPKRKNESPEKFRARKGYIQIAKSIKE